MLASLAVDMADHYQKTHVYNQERLNALQMRRKDVEKKLANFVTAIAAGIFNETTAQAMSALEEEKKELDAAIQAENVKTTLLENQKTIGEFYKKYAHATIDTKETRDQLFEYFIDKIFLGTDTITIATYYYDTNKPIELKDLENAHEMREVRTFPKEFDTSPRSGP
ncbi:MAG: hypothetical protein IKZ87_00675 [Actinomycetaceae bacterium]|nr:hypothetical protein [Actinomycetaceae bacterium]